MAAAETLVVISAASAWEIAVKTAAGKLTITGDLWPGALDDGMVELAITSEHARAAGALPLHHRDPFDRMLIAQAVVEGLTIVTADAQFEHYDVPLLRADRTT